MFNFVVINIIFEFISLLYIITNEENKSMAQILYLQKLADRTVVEKGKLLRQERIIYCLMRTLMLYSFIVRCTGFLVRLEYLKFYTNFKEVQY